MNVRQKIGLYSVAGLLGVGIGHTIYNNVKQHREKIDDIPNVYVEDVDMSVLSACDNDIKAYMASRPDLAAKFAVKEYEENNRKIKELEEENIKINNEIKLLKQKNVKIANKIDSLNNVK